jgi:hypothetical protein
VSDTDLDWPVRNWGYVYLGWTGDINGVDLPLGSGGGSGDGSEDDMPEYVHTSLSGVTLPGDSWQFLEWSKVISDTTGKAAAKGEAGIRIGGRRYAATLIVQADVASGQRVSTRTSESAPNNSGGYDRVETNPPVEHLRTDGTTSLEDTRAGWVGDDRRLRFEVLLPVKGTVSADLVVLYW